MKPSEELLAHRDKVMGFGGYEWVNRGPREGTEVCSIALYKSGKSIRAFSGEAYRYLFYSLDHPAGVTHWNDSSLRTREDVIDALEAASKLAAEDGR